MNIETKFNLKQTVMIQLTAQITENHFGWNENIKFGWARIIGIQIDSNGEIYYYTDYPLQVHEKHVFNNREEVMKSFELKAK